MKINHHHIGIVVVENGYGSSKECIIVSVKNDNNDKTNANIFGINDRCHITKVYFHSSHVSQSFPFPEPEERVKEPISVVEWIQIATTTVKETQHKKRLNIRI